MPKYRNPQCQAPDPETGRVCGVRMKPLGERHPSFGPNWKPGGWVFECARCGAIRFIEEQRAARYVEQIR